VGFCAALDFRDWAEESLENAPTNKSAKRINVEKRRAEHIDFMFYLSESGFVKSGLRKAETLLRPILIVSYKGA
jgi:hypothetical protein